MFYPPSDHYDTPPAPAPVPVPVPVPAPVSTRASDKFYDEYIHRAHLRSHNEGRAEMKDAHRAAVERQFDDHVHTLNTGNYLTPNQSFDSFTHSGYLENGLFHRFFDLYAYNPFKYTAQHISTIPKGYSMEQHIFRLSVERLGYINRELLYFAFRDMKSHKEEWVALGQFALEVSGNDRRIRVLNFLAGKGYGIYGAGLHTYNGRPTILNRMFGLASDGKKRDAARSIITREQLMFANLSKRDAAQLLATILHVSHDPKDKSVPLFEPNDITRFYFLSNDMLAKVGGESNSRRAFTEFFDVTSEPARDVDERFAMRKHYLQVEMKKNAKEYIKAINKFKRGIDRTYQESRNQEEIEHNKIKLAHWLFSQYHAWNQFRGRGASSVAAPADSHYKFAFTLRDEDKRKLEREVVGRHSNMRGGNGSRTVMRGGRSIRSASSAHDFHLHFHQNKTMMLNNVFKHENSDEYLTTLKLDDVEKMYRTAIAPDTIRYMNAYHMYPKHGVPETIDYNPRLIPDKYPAVQRWDFGFEYYDLYINERILEPGEHYVYTMSNMAYPPADYTHDQWDFHLLMTRFRYIMTALEQCLRQDIKEFPNEYAKYGVVYSRKIEDVLQFLVHGSTGGRDREMEDYHNAQAATTTNPDSTHIYAGDKTDGVSGKLQKARYDLVAESSDANVYMNILKKNKYLNTPSPSQTPTDPPPPSPPPPPTPAKGGRRTRRQRRGRQDHHHHHHHHHRTRSRGSQCGGAPKSGWNYRQDDPSNPYSNYANGILRRLRDKRVISPEIYLLLHHVGDRELAMLVTKLLAVEITSRSVPRVSVRRSLFHHFFTANVMRLGDAEELRSDKEADTEDAKKRRNERWQRELAMSIQMRNVFMYQLSYIYKFQVSRIRSKIAPLIRKYNDKRQRLDAKIDKSIAALIRRYDKFMFFFFVGCLREKGNWDNLLETKDKNRDPYYTPKAVAPTHYDHHQTWQRYVEVAYPPKFMYLGEIGI